MTRLLKMEMVQLPIPTARQTRVCHRPMTGRDTHMLHMLHMLRDMHVFGAIGISLPGRMLSSKFQEIEVRPDVQIFCRLKV